MPANRRSHHPIVFKRHRLLLELVLALGGTARYSDFENLLFLYSIEGGEDRHYDFVPLTQGVHSFTSEADQRKLLERNLLVSDGNTIMLTEDGERIARERIHRDLPVFVREQLGTDVYRKLPERSGGEAINTRFFRSLGAASKAERSESRSLLTIGYEGQSLEAYLNALLDSQVTILCDVRKNPLSRKYGFSKRILQEGCRVVGIQYEHLPDLGISGEFRRNLNSQDDYDELFNDYRRRTLPFVEDSLNRIVSWIEAGHRVALTCYEKAPHQCHRSCVAQALENRLGPSVRAEHI